MDRVSTFRDPLNLSIVAYHIMLDVYICLLTTSWLCSSMMATAAPLVFDTALIYHRSDVMS